MEAQEAECTSDAAKFSAEVFVTTCMGIHNGFEA